MANNVYPSVPVRALSALIGAYPVVCSVHASQSYNAAHEVFADVSATAVAQVTLTGVTMTGGALKASPAVMPDVEIGSTITSYIVWVNTGNAATSPILCRYDTDGDAVAISEATTGGDVTVTFDTDGIMLFEVGS